jgi:hypothetical protein
MDAFCVHCDHRIDLGPGASVGRRVTCPACQAYLEVISLSPVELDWAYDQPLPNPGQPGTHGDRRYAWPEIPLSR